jgi:hypothetical protein
MSPKLPRVDCEQLIRALKRMQALKSNDNAVAVYICAGRPMPGVSPRLHTEGAQFSLELYELFYVTPISMLMSSKGF